MDKGQQRSRNYRPTRYPCNSKASKLSASLPTANLSATNITRAVTYVDVALALQRLVLWVAVGSTGLRRREAAHAQGDAVAAEMVLQQKVCRAALAPHIRVEIGGDAGDRCVFAVTAKIPGGGAVAGLRDPLAIRAIGKAGGDAVPEHDKRMVLQIIGQAAGKFGSCTIDVIGKGIAIGVIGDGGAADGGGDWKTVGDCLAFSFIHRGEALAKNSLNSIQEKSARHRAVVTLYVGIPQTCDQNTPPPASLGQVQPCAASQGDDVGKDLAWAACEEFFAVLNRRRKASVRMKTK
jgi:hypothetical protein